MVAGFQDDVDLDDHLPSSKPVPAAEVVPSKDVTLSSEEEEAAGHSTSFTLMANEQDIGKRYGVLGCLLQCAMCCRQAHYINTIPSLCDQGGFCPFFSRGRG